MTKAAGRGSTQTETPADFSAAKALCLRTVSNSARAIPLDIAAGSCDLAFTNRVRSRLGPTPAAQTNHIIASSGCAAGDHG